MDWRKIIERLTDERKRIHVEAHRLADGRRVFETEDGERVYDEHGNKATDEIHPEEIPDHLEKWESLQKPDKALANAERRFDEALKHQRVLDGARSRHNEGGLKNQDINELEQMIELSKPE